MCVFTGRMLSGCNGCLLFVGLISIYWCELICFYNKGSKKIVSSGKSFYDVETMIYSSIYDFTFIGGLLR